MKGPIILDGPVRDDGTLDGDAAAAKAAAVIRERSSAGQLISETELIRFLQDPPTLHATNMTAEEVTELLARLVLGNEDLHALNGAGSQWYYSSRSMTDAYAKILIQTLEGPVRLIAETVRHNSCAYQRPVPLDLFMEPPFSLTHHQVLDGLETMAATEGYEDIATATTSASGVYLYSTRHLEEGHAEMLAEWFDVGQAENP
jgi:hypothetical protein